MIEQQLKSKQAVQMPGLAQNGSNGAGMHGQGMSSAQQQMGQAAANAAGQSNQDFSVQWAEYYRSIGKIDEAEAIEKQIQAQKVKTIN